MHSATVAECIVKMKILQKDLEYLGGLAEKWDSQKGRFPLIVEGIGIQRETFSEMIEKLKLCPVVDIPFEVTFHKDRPGSLTAPEETARA